MRATVKLPGLSRAVSQVIFHYVAVFAFAFGTQMVASVTGSLSVSSLLAAITSAAAAGLVAVAHVVLGLIPVQDQYGELTYGISLKVRTAGYQVLVSVLVTFVSILGAQLAGGAAGVTSLPDLVAVVLSAIAAGVTGVVTFVTGLIPAPKP